jgi:hypothetical protein
MPETIRPVAKATMAALVRRESIYNPEVACIRHNLYAWHSRGEEEAFYDAGKPSWFRK